MKVFHYRKVEIPATHLKLASKCELHPIVVFSADCIIRLPKYEQLHFENEYKLYLFSYSVPTFFNVPSKASYTQEDK